MLDDLAYYWFHRTAHRVRWFWASHVNHHSSQHYNLSTALRQTWTGSIALGFVFRLPLVLLGFHPAMILFVRRDQPDLPVLDPHRGDRPDAALVRGGDEHALATTASTTPPTRAISTATMPGCSSSGTGCSAPSSPNCDDERIRYGIVRQLGSFNLLWAAFHEWIGIASDLWPAPWRHKLCYLWREPGWSHDGSRDTSDTIRARWLARSEPR